MNINQFRFLPFRYKKFGKSVLLVNDCGEYIFIDEKEFLKLIDKNFESDSKAYYDLQSKNMICDHKYLPSKINLLATKYKTKKRFLYESVTLHMIVVTQRCNQSCYYCHASSQSDNQNPCFDMDINTVKRCVEIILSSPSPYLKIEFQGGEPLLNFKVIKEAILYSEKLKILNGKIIEYVICTNLTLLELEHIEFIKKYNIAISTSLDGNKETHDKCRKFYNEEGSYQKVINKINFAKDNGIEKISALMTVTPFNIKELNKVVDTYISTGLPSIFLRMMNPFGRASLNKKSLYYEIDEFIEAYKEVLIYIIDLNISGLFFPEEFTTILLNKILTPFSTGFVDLQSPTGAGINGVIYETNGDVYIADEGRMLFRMNSDNTFQIGNVNRDSWISIFCNPKLQRIVSSTCIESIPGCAWCVYQPYCGSDPIRNYIEFQNFHGNNTKSNFCRKYKKIFDFIFSLLSKNNDETMNVFWSWVTNRNIDQIRINRNSDEVI